MSNTSAPAPPDLLASALGVAELAATMDRRDLAERIRASVTRARRPGTVVVVIGEFKQGKSSLVNGLVGRGICPVDDDIATSALTVLVDAPEVNVVVHRRVEGELRSVAIEPGLLPSVVTEHGNPGNQLGIERVDVGVPSRLLAQGVAIVDSPGAGGLGAGHAAATLAFLPYADAVLFVTDASAELSAPELAFLAEAGERCRRVVVCLTKIDLQPRWRDIVALDRGHLDRVGVDAPIMPVSSLLRAAAIEHRDREMNDESGYPALLDLLRDEVIDKAREVAAEQAEREAADALTQLQAALQSELAVLQDPVVAAATVQAAEEAIARFEHLKLAGARWSQVLNDRLTSLNSDIGFSFRDAQRAWSKTVEDRLEKLSNAKAWDLLCRDVQTEVAESVAALVARMDEGAIAAAEAVAEALDAEVGVDVHPVIGVDTGALWQSARREERDKVTKTAARSVGQTVGALRGAQSGIMLLGMLGTLLPGAATTLGLANPIGLSIGAAFGVKAVLDQRKRRVSEGRQKIRMALKQFLDEVGFRVGNEITSSLRTIHQQLRDQVGERVTELQRSAAEVASQASQAAQLDAEARAARTVVVKGLLAAAGEIGLDLGDQPVPR
ncbi:MAG TPA: dynamin family protein [Acidimicrobiales bacterium]